MKCHVCGTHKKTQEIVGGSGYSYYCPNANCSSAKQPDKNPDKSVRQKFKVGDRVRVYGQVSGVGRHYSASRHGTSPARIIDLTDSRACDGYLIVRFEDEPTASEYIYQVHPKQCRRLVKKERRRVWVSSYLLENVFQGLAPVISGLPNNPSITSTSLPNPNSSHDVVLIEFVEVKRK